MKVLLDTNIIIDREASTVKNEDIGSLFSWLDKLHYDKCIHQLTVKEIERHGDPKVVNTFKIKLSSYDVLKTEAPMAESVSNLIQKMDKLENDINDTKLINELVNHRVDFLVTEDEKIHEKARILNVDSKVFTIKSFLKKVISENPSLIHYKTLSIKQEYFGNINLKDTFFDSFRNDYQGFDEWFNTKSNESAYVYSDSNSILAFLYIKTENENENYSNIVPIFPNKKRLKIGTFKVSLKGYKLGERFLKIVFDNAIKKRVDEIYVTIFDKDSDHKMLIDLLCDWGFKLWGTKKSKSGEEKVYVRDFSRLFDVSNPKLTFPYFSLSTDVYLVPIYPAYHTSLFPDSILNTESPEDFERNESFINALSKVYVSRAFPRNMRRGDTLIFYRTAPFGEPGRYKSVITTIGVIESVVTDIKDIQEFISLCKKRSVFTDEELVGHWRYKDDKPFIVNFLYNYSFPHRINLQGLIDLGVIRDIQSAPRGFEKISRENFEKILKNTNTDEQIIVR